LFNITVKIDGEVSLIADDHKPCIYVCNHQSVIDMVAIWAIFPTRTVILAKKSLLYVPIFGQIYWLVGHYLVDRKKHEQGMQVMAAIADKVKKSGASVFIFPEGTRNRKGGLLPFKKGAFHLAVQAQVSVTLTW
jgi:1-acyl-sn-glycerol-3-phosphate acyltransferase